MKKSIFIFIICSAIALNMQSQIITTIAGTGTTTGANTQRTATPVASNKHVPTYADGTEPLLWSYTIYLLVP